MKSSERQRGGVVKLGELCRSVCSGGTPKSSVSRYYDGGSIPWLNTKEIGFNCIWDTERHITEEGLQESSAKWIPANSVIVAMYGATAAKCCINKIPLTTNQACCNLTLNDALCDYRYIYYYLMFAYNELSSLANGGAQQNLNVQVIKNFQIYLPPLPEQKRIAAILSSLDDKIENNKRINRHLEQMAQALFKSWFVDFSPFGGKMPSNWKKAYLGNAFIFQRGVGITKNDVASFRDKEHPYVVYGAGREVFGYSKMFALENPSVLVAAIGAGAGTVSRSHEAKYSITSNVFYVTVRNPYEYSYAVYALKRFDFSGRCSGSAQPMLAYGAFATDEILIPPESILQKFNELCTPLMRMVDLNLQNATSLAHLRDMLLPRLMSGEIIACSNCFTDVRGS